MILEVSLREFRAQNPEDRREVSHRFDATWGEKRIVRKGHLYRKHYEASVDALEPPVFDDRVHLGQRQRTIENAKLWARRNFVGLDWDDMDQEIEVKAWLLEEHELDERGEWARPAYVMVALKNAVKDYARREIGYRKVNHVTDEVIVTSRLDAPPDHAVSFTKKTLKAALVLFVEAPHMLSHGTRDVVRTVVYENLSPAERRALAECVFSPNDTANRTLNKVVGKYIDATNKCD